MPTAKGIVVISDITDGAAGPTGARGAGWWRYDAGADNLSLVDTTAEVKTYWDLLHNPDILPVKDDRFIIATTDASGPKAFIFDGTDWILQSAFIDGQLLVSGTVTANAMAADSITAENGAISSLAVKRINIEYGAVTEPSLAQYTSNSKNMNYTTSGTTTTASHSGTWGLKTATFSQVGTLVTVVLDTPLATNFFNELETTVGSRVTVVSSTGSLYSGFTINAILNKNTTFTFIDTVSRTASGVISLNFNTHIFQVGDLVYLDFQTGLSTNLDNFYTITSIPNFSSFTVTHASSPATSGTVRRRICVDINKSITSYDGFFRGGTNNINWRTDIKHYTFDIWIPQWYKEFGTTVTSYTDTTFADVLVRYTVSIYNMGQYGEKKELIQSFSPLLHSATYRRGVCWTPWEFPHFKYEGAINPFNTTLQDGDILNVELQISNTTTDSKYVLRNVYQYGTIYLNETLVYR